jgi:hypothetical protein
MRCPIPTSSEYLLSQQADRAACQPDGVQMVDPVDVCGRLAQSSGGAMPASEAETGHDQLYWIAKKEA